MQKWTHLAGSLPPPAFELPGQFRRQSLCDAQAGAEIHCLSLRGLQPARTMEGERDGR